MNQIIWEVVLFTSFGKGPNLPQEEKARMKCEVAFPEDVVQMARGEGHLNQV